MHENAIIWKKMRESCVDTFDLRILHALQADGALTNAQLAEWIGLSPSQCSRRRAALEADGVITGYRALISPEALGLGVLAFVQVSLAAHSPDNARRFRELVRQIDAIQEAYAMTGEADYQLKVIVPDLKSLSHILNDVLLPHDSVAQVRSSIVLDRLKEAGSLPLPSSAR